jgi:hypothetical protein
VPLGRKTVVQRPLANEGGREEEENRFGIAVGKPDRLHDREIETTSALSLSCRVSSPPCG